MLNNEVRIFKMGLKDGAIAYNLNPDMTAEEAMRNYSITKRKAYNLGYNLGKTGNYQQQYKAGKDLAYTAVERGDMLPDGWEYYQDPQGFYHVSDNL